MCSTHLASSFWDVLADLLCLLRALLHNKILRLCLPLQQYWQLFSACSISNTPHRWMASKSFQMRSLWRRQSHNPSSFIFRNGHLDKDSLTGLRLLLHPLHRLIGGDIDTEFLQIKISWSDSLFWAGKIANHQIRNPDNDDNVHLIVEIHVFLVGFRRRSILSLISTYIVVGWLVIMVIMVNMVSMAKTRKCVNKCQSSCRSQPLTLWQHL